MRSSIASTLNDTLARIGRQFAVPGMVAAIYCNGMPVWTGATGHSNIDDKNAISANAPFLIYSITKSFTSVCLLRLAEQGRVGLDDRVGQWIDAPTLIQDVTIRQLLNHTAGVPNYGDVAAYHAAVEKNPSTPWTYEQFIEHTCKGKLDFVPGTAWRYSNTGYMFLRHIIEQITGQTFAQAIQDQIVRPLGLKQTSIAISRDDLHTATPGYSRLFSESDDRDDVRSIYHPGWCATGVAVSTASDIARFYDALFAGKLIGRTWLDQMLTLVPVPGKHPPAIAPACGLGILADTGASGGTTYGHGGGGPGYNVQAVVAPNLNGRRAVVTAFCNSDEGQPADAAALALLTVLRSSAESHL